MKPVLRLTNREQLIGAIHARHPAIRFKTLSAIVARPDLVERFAGGEQDEVVEALWRRLSIESEGPIRKKALEALRRLPSDAVVARCAAALDRAGHAQAMAAASILAERDLSGCDRLVRIRVWLLTGNTDALAGSLDECHAREWLQILSGEDGALARRCLTACAARALRLLSPHRAKLDAVSRAWLVGLLAQDSSAQHDDLLREALESDDPGVLMAASKVCSSRYSVLPPDVRQSARGLHEHPDPAVRIAASDIPAAAATLESRYLEERDGRVRARLLRALSHAGAAQPALLAAALERGAWRERAEAVDAFVRLGLSAIGELRELAVNGTEGCRAGALQALAQLGDDAWIESLGTDRITGEARAAPAMPHG